MVDSTLEIVVKMEVLIQGEKYLDFSMFYPPNVWYFLCSFLFLYIYLLYFLNVSDTKRSMSKKWCWLGYKNVAADFVKKEGIFIQRLSFGQIDLKPFFRMCPNKIQNPIWTL